MTRRVRDDAREGKMKIPKREDCIHSAVCTGDHYQTRQLLSNINSVMRRDRNEMLRSTKRYTVRRIQNESENIKQRR